MNPFTDRNRQNAQASTGPKTEEGKARSSRNALKNGLYAKAALLPEESREEYLAFTSSLVVELKPAGPLQAELVQTVSDSLWRLRRIRIAEASQTERLSDIIVDLPEQTAAEVRSLESIGRHETRIQNVMLKALNQLKELQKTSQPQQAKSKPAPSGFVPAVQYAAAASSEPAFENAAETAFVPDTGEQKRAA